MIEEIRKETQLLDSQTGESVHTHLNSFILVVISTGTENTVIGSDDKHINISDILDLLSPKNFCVMRGNPKLVLIQGVEGSKLD